MSQETGAGIVAGKIAEAIEYLLGQADEADEGGGGGRVYSLTHCFEVEQQGDHFIVSVWIGIYALDKLRQASMDGYDNIQRGTSAPWSKGAQSHYVREAVIAAHRAHTEAVRKLLLNELEKLLRVVVATDRKIIVNGSDRDMQLARLFRVTISDTLPGRSAAA